jgi:predicted O-methyltransferase YrrM
MSPRFTEDWSFERKYWDDLLKPLKGKPGLHFLEIGCFEGQATRWLLENVLTGEGSDIYVVDPFTGSLEHDRMGVDTENLFDRFHENVREFERRVFVSEGLSQDVLRSWEDRTDEFFDFVYVDGDHTASAVLEDAVLAWPMLKPGGHMVFDDYEWDGGGIDLNEYEKPKIAVDAFLRVHGDDASVVHQGYQVAALKL